MAADVIPPPAIIFSGPHMHSGTLDLHSILTRSLIQRSSMPGRPQILNRQDGEAQVTSWGFKDVFTWTDGRYALV